MGLDGMDGMVILYCCDTKSIATAMLITMKDIKAGSQVAIKTFLKKTFGPSLLSFTLSTSQIFPYK